MNTPFVLGIDVGKQNLQATLLDTQRRDQPLWCEEFRNAPAGIKALLGRLPVGTVLVVEPTGHYSEAVVRGGWEAGHTVLMASPRKARHYLQARLDRVKTDRVDSRGLAEYGASVNLAPFELKEPQVERALELLNQRRLAADSLSRFRQQVRDSKYPAEAMRQAIEALRATVTELDRQLAEERRQNPALEPARRLLQVPGFGPLISFALCVRLNQRPFARADSFVAFCGLDVTVHQSGNSRAPGHISHEGEPELRRLLYLAAMGAVRTKAGPFKAEYERLQATGRCRTEALCIIARKLARLAWSLHRHGTSYDPTKVFGPRP